MSFVQDLIRQEHLPLPLSFIAEYDKDVILKSVCAILNGEGGWIVVGMSSDGRCVGISEDNIVDNLQQSITYAISPIPMVYIQKEKVEDKTVMLLTVMKGSLGPYSFNGKFYLREGHEIVVPDTQQLASLLANDSSGQDIWELRTCMQAEESDIDPELMRHVYQEGKKRKRVITNEEGSLNVTLRRLRLLGSSTVSNGVVALLGSNTTFFLRQCRVRIQLMVGGKTSDTYQDVQTIEGNMFAIHKRVMKYFESLPRTASFVDTKGYRAENYIYPLDVMDEAVTNALVHRSYNGFLDEITIFIYKDKVEVTNPGEMMGDFLVRGKVKPHGSILRNPVMAEVFYMAGMMEKSGRGISLIYNGMSDKGYNRPTWKSANGHTTLTIYSSKAKIATLNERMISFIGEHQKGDLFSKAEYMKRFGVISKITAQTDIQKLVELGFCQPKGSGPSTKYLIIKTDR